MQSDFSFFLWNFYLVVASNQKQSSILGIFHLLSFRMTQIFLFCYGGGSNKRKVYLVRTQILQIIKILHKRNSKINDLIFFFAVKIRNIADISNKKRKLIQEALLPIFSQINRVFLYVMS